MRVCKIALVQIAIGEAYYDFFEKFYPLNKRNFLPNKDVDVHLFTDYSRYVRSREKVFVHEVKSWRWPHINFLKYLYCLEILERGGYDYIFYLDTDNVFESPVPINLLDNDFSLLRVHCWESKYAGAFWGGKAGAVKIFCEALKKDILPIMNGDRFPEKENDEALIQKIDHLSIKAHEYNFEEVFSWGLHGRRFSPQWISQVEKDFEECHQYGEYRKFSRLEGRCIIDLDTKLVSVFDWKSYSHYGRLKHIGDNKWEIRWKDEKFGRDIIEL